MALDELNNDNNSELHTINEIEMLISQEIAPHAQGMMLDYVDDERGRGFSLGRSGGGDCGCGH